MNNPIRIYHVDDDPLYTAHFKTIAERMPAFEYLGAAPAAWDAMAVLPTLQPDIIFLDVEMPGNDGLWLARQLKGSSSMLVFCSNHTGYAIEAFKYYALHYIVKPASEADLEEVKLRYQERTQQKNSLQEERITDLLASLEKQKHPERIYVNTQKSIEIIDLAEVSFLYAEGSYCHIIKADGVDITVTKNLKTYADFLEKKPEFIRIHRSYIINQHHLSKIVKADVTYTFLFKNGRQLKISSFRKEDWMKHFVK